MSIPLTSSETNTPLGDGGYVHAFNNVQGPNGPVLLETQKYDASGAPVGPLFVMPGLTLGLGYSGQYAIGAQPNGGYVILAYDTAPRTTGIAFAQVVGADGLPVGGLVNGGGPPTSLTIGSTGDFVIAGIVEPRLGIQSPTVQLFGSTGQSLSPTINLAGPIASIIPGSNGVMLVNWDDVSAVRTVTLDPATASGLTAPAGPTVDVLDSSGQVIGNTPTTDLLPTLRVHVQQAGEVFVDYPSNSAAALGGGVPVTAADVARGYVDIQVNAPPVTGSISVAGGYVRFADANGVASPFAQFVVPEAADPNAGQTFYGAYQDNLVGTSANDVFFAALQGSETWAGGGGSDTFAFSRVPWTPDRITDFTVGQDRLYLRPLFPNLAGDDPIAAGYVTLISDGQGGTDVLVNPDGHATAANPWPTFVVDLANISPVGLTANDLFGGSTSPPPPPPPTGGVTITGSGYGDVLTGGAGNDTLIASTPGTETMAGDGGADLFVFNQIPWTPDRITDFTVGQDKLDLHALYPGFTGSDPIAAGYVTLISDGQGGTDVLVNPDGQATAANPWPTFVVDLVGVSPAGLTANDLFGGSSPPPPPPPPPTGGVTITGSGYGDVLTGGAGDDTLIASTQGTETMSGDGGADLFVFQQIPWTPDRITDFTLGQDKLDLHALYPGFTGSDPIAAGYVTLISDGQGGTDVLVNPDGHATAAHPWPTFVVDLAGVSPAQLANSVWLA